MIGERFVKKEYGGVEFILDLEGYPNFDASGLDLFECLECRLSIDEMLDLLNKLFNENEKLKNDYEDLRWKYEERFMRHFNQTVIDELRNAIYNGYELSSEFKEYIDDFNKKIIKNIKK